MTDNTLPKFDVHNLRVCGCCLQLIANGEINNGTDDAEVTSAGQVATWGPNVTNMIAGGPHGDDCDNDGSTDCDCEDFGFSWSDCEGCGSALGGDRYAATVLIPLP